jgi:hypothetical protein
MNKFERNIMAGVAVIYIVRRLTSQRALKAYALFFSLLGVALFASLPHVFNNFLHVESEGLPAMGPFLLSAITKTNFVVQAALLVGVVVLFSIARDLFKPSDSRHFA